MRNVIPVIWLSWSIAGCSTYAADRYAVSMDAQAELKQIVPQSANQVIAIDRFTASEPGKTKITCRALAPIKTPDGQTFEAFVQQALVDQLRLAELHAPDAPIHIGGNLDEIGFSSTEGLWSLALTVTDNSGRSFSVREEYNYVTSWNGETACNQTAQALMPAVQNLIGKVVSHPTFEDMIIGG